MCAVDRWVRAAFFQAVFVALGFFLFDKGSRPSHLPRSRQITPALTQAVGQKERVETNE